jgi:hypothetical protein
MHALTLVVYVLISLCALASPAMSPAATHRLSVAANPGLYVTSAEVDEIIAEMNKLMASSAYPWDEVCEEVKFERRGEVIQHPALMITGTHAELFKNLKEVAPSAHVLVVTGINCSGVQAAGCGPIGTEPMIVGQYPDFNAQLWLHERGHNVGLKHSGEGPLMAESFAPEIGRRFMFWMLGIGHVGKSAEECKAFRTANFASVSPDLPRRAMRSNLLALAETQLAPFSAEAFAVVASPEVLPPSRELLVAQGSPAMAQPSPSFDAEFAKAAAEANLTPQAYRIIGAPWVDGAPIEAIKKLSEPDLDSVRQVLRGSPNRYWSQAIGVLGVAGSAQDVTLIKSALDLPMPAVDPAADRETIRAVRNLTSIKLAAPLALGILANRTKSSQAVDILKDTSNLDRSTGLVGRDTATTLSKSALSALAVADTPASKSYIDTVIKLQQGGQLSEPISKINLDAARAVPITEPEATILNRNTLDVQQRGIDAYMKRGSLSGVR